MDTGMEHRIHKIQDMAWGVSNWFEPSGKGWAVVHTLHPSTPEVGAGGPLWIPGQPGLLSEFRVHQGYIEKPCLEKEENKNSEKTFLLWLAANMWSFQVKG